MIIRKAAWLLIEDRKLLGAKSKSKELYYIPGGKIEENESEKVAVIREISEELSVDLTPESIEYYDTFTAQADGKTEGVSVEVVCFMAEYQGTLKADNEIEAFAWLTTSDLAKVSPVNKLILTNLKQKNLID